MNICKKCNMLLHVPKTAEWNNKEKDEYNCMLDIMGSGWVVESEYVERELPKECKYKLEQIVIQDKGE